MVTYLALYLALAALLHVSSVQGKAGITRSLLPLPSTMRWAMHSVGLGVHTVCSRVLILYLVIHSYVQYVCLRLFKVLDNKHS